MITLPPLNALRAFNAAARHLNFSLAAKELCVTHSAVSHQVRHLEDWMGCTLFVRHAGGVRLTDAGQSLQQTTQQAFGLLEARCEELLNRNEPRHLLLAAPASFLANWLIPRIERFEARHPDIIVKLQTNADLAALQTRQVDAIILAGQNWPADTLARPLFAETIGPVCAPSQAENITTAEDVILQPMLQTSSRPLAWQDWAKQNGLNGAQIKPGRQFDHLGLMLEAATAGLGIAIAPSVLIAQELYRHRLVAPLGFVASGASFCLCTRENDTASPQLTQLHAWLTDEAASDAAGMP
ncbi:LysR substrate-binding domain-containing protein [Thalassospira sp.]|uniref:LysR substrate-binding domain-containing protein n=1 Tax=Thalassospira sp. TaxID=1912094 RepID=UPI003AA8C98F